MTVGDRIRSARMDAGLTQRQLAEKCGVHPSTVNNWEAGANVTVDTAAKICSVLCMSLDELVGIEEDPTESIRRFDFTCAALRKMLGGNSHD